MTKILLVVVAVLIIGSNSVNVYATEIKPRDGWVVVNTNKTHKELVKALKVATKVNKMNVVTQAGPTNAAKKRGIVIPNNLVVGVFGNQFAVDILKLSTEAMIEAPIRFYVTENKNLTATLSYKKPTFVFQPYYEQGGDELKKIAQQLDQVFGRISQQATQ